jgi:hypothetical protein
MPYPLVLAMAAIAPVAAVEVPFRVADDAIVVDAAVNGRKASLMFDTGFSGAVVVGSTINLGPATGTVQLRDFVGAFEAKTCKITGLLLGSHKLDTEGLEAVQEQGGHYTESYGTHCDGILGLEPMAREVFEINFERRVFVFHPPTTDISTRKPDGKRTFLLKMLPRGHGSVELTAELPDGQKMYLALDTGNAYYATTHKDVLERVGLWKEGRKPEFMGSSMVASGPVGSFAAQFPKVTIFGVPVQDSIWSIIDLPSSSADHDGTVGFGFLKHFNITIDRGRRRVWLENFAGRAVEEPLGSVGMLGTYDERRQRMRAVAVTPGGPADRAGIKNGDDLLAVGGEELVNVGWRRLEAMLKGPDGTKVEVAFSRGGELRRVELERRVLVNRLGPPASR